MVCIRLLFIFVYHYRFVNFYAYIGKTDQLVWDAIKGVLQQIHDKPLQSSFSIQSDHHGFNDSNLVPSAEINLETNTFSDDRMTPLELSQSQQSNMNLSGQSSTQASNLHPFNGVASIAEYLSPDRIDLLSDQERKSVVNSLLSKVSVFFDSETKKHTLDVEFTHGISRLLTGSVHIQEESEVVGGYSEVFNDALEASTRAVVAKKSQSSVENLAAEQDYIVTVE